MARLEARHHEEIAAVHPDHHADAVNLVHYLALRQGDVRRLQRRLGERGLSSLGRCEPHVLATVESVRAALDGMDAHGCASTTLSFEEGRAALDRNTDALFGPRPPGQRAPHHGDASRPRRPTTTCWFGTWSLGAWTSPASTSAHDDPSHWEQMARNVRKASAEVGSPLPGIDGPARAQDPHRPARRRDPRS